MYIIKAATSNLPLRAIAGRFVYAGVAEAKFRGLHLTMQNTETGEIVKRFWRSHFGDIYDYFDSYSPYGRVLVKAINSNAPVGSLFQVIDDASWRFLSYVDSCQLCSFYPGYAVCDKSQGRGYLSDITPFRAVDAINSIFVCNFVDARYPYFATLYNVVCYIEDGWHGDEFYIFAGFSEDSDRNMIGNFYRVVFNDVSKARHLMAQSVIGNNRVIANFRETIKAIGYWG